MPFGIHLASDICQAYIAELIEHLPGVLNCHIHKDVQNFASADLIATSYVRKLAGTDLIGLNPLLKSLITLRLVIKAQRIAQNIVARSCNGSRRR